MGDGFLQVHLSKFTLFIIRCVDGLLTQTVFPAVTPR